MCSLLTSWAGRITFWAKGAWRDGDKAALGNFDDLLCLYHVSRLSPLFSKKKKMEEIQRSCKLGCRYCALTQPSLPQVFKVFLSLSHILRQPNLIRHGITARPLPSPPSPSPCRRWWRRRALHKHSSSHNFRRVLWLCERDLQFSPHPQVWLVFVDVT